MPFVLLLLLVQAPWAPLLAADAAVRDGLHTFAVAHPMFVSIMRVISDSGSFAAWQSVTVLVAAALVVRRRIRQAVFVVVTVAGSSVINRLVKTAVHRDRPLVDHPLLLEQGYSFPSGHAQAAATGYAVVLVVLLPLLTRTWRRVAVTVAVVMVIAMGFSRVALGVHYLSDVVAAYPLGLAWVAVMASAFHVWQHDSPDARTTSRPR